jgi:molybdopterin synthase sulfur carrier subunit
MKILYFAWLREKTGVAEEDAAPPGGTQDVAALIEWLKGRGGGFADAFDDLAVVRVAVNQEYVTLDHPVGPDDEVAFFPPVTGGLETGAGKEDRDA